MKKTVQYLLTLIVVAGCVYFPAKWTYDWRLREVFNQEMDVYEKKVGPEVAMCIYQGARRRGFLNDYDAGGLAARLSKLKSHDEIPPLPFSFQLSTDFYSSVIRETRQAVWHAAADKIRDEMGLKGSPEMAGKEVQATYYRRIKEELAWFDEYEKLADLYNKLPLYYPDTMQDLARYETELKEVRPQLEQLLAKL